MKTLQLRDERGSVILIVAAALFALTFFVAFVVDVGNWKEHKRHLQLQADAAALAAAGSFALPCNAAVSNAVSTTAHNYGGTDATHIAPSYVHNDQVDSKYVGGFVPNLHILVNSVSYYGDAGAGENSGGATCPTNADPPNQFCSDPTRPTLRVPGVDIKATETDLPWFFGGFVRKINAHAVVCLMQETSGANALPIAVPNPKPKSAAAIFINRGSGNSIVGTPLPLTACPACPAPSGITIWSSAAGGSNVPVVAQTGLVIAISGLTNLSLAGDLATICDQPLTTCFDASNDPPSVGVNFIQGWSNSGDGKQPAPPVLKGVQLFPGTCPGDAYYEYITGGCSLTLAAVVAAAAPGGSDLTGMSITVSGAGCPAKGCTLTKNTDVPAPPECAAVMAGATGRCWMGSIPISARAGAQELQIVWNESTGTVGGKDCTKGSGCNGNFPGIAQQAYTADDLPKHNISGPLQIVQINACPSPACLSQGNSLPLGASAPPIAVTIGLRGALQNALNASDPTASCTFDDGSVHAFSCLKVTVTNAGSTQSINCDPLANPKKDLDDQLALGCAPEYKINDGTPGPWTPCPKDNQLGDPDHQEPWLCTALFTGNKTPLVSKGINRRIFSTPTPPPCPAYGSPGHNNWAMYDPTDPSGRDGFPAGDKRIVGVYLTAYGAFFHTAGTSLTIPVTDFATFYITGYDGSPCTNPPVAATDHPDDPIPDKGTIVGHFIKYVDRLNTGGGTTPCEADTFGSCVPVMTK